MAKCDTIRVKHRSLCTGDLDRKITLVTRAQDAPINIYDYKNSFATKLSCWAGLKTTKGRQMFYTTNEDVAVSHIFYVRYSESVYSTDWIQYGSENYDIVDVENIDERSEWIAIYCNVRGLTSSAVNNA
jgi:SPP1 family predicted phage head-tail adaptor